MAATLTEVVYYIRKGEHIKIGLTTQFVVRMRALRPDEVLAVEPGGRDVELARHLQFSACHLPEHPAGREWFNPSSDLLAHIEQVAAAHGVPCLPPPGARHPRPRGSSKRPDRPFAAPEQRLKMAKGFRDLRKEAGLTQEQLAERTGIEQSTISAIERCRRRVFLEDIRVICRAIDTPRARVMLKLLEAFRIAVLELPDGPPPRRKSA